MQCHIAYPHSSCVSILLHLLLFLCPSSVNKMLQILQNRMGQEQEKEEVFGVLLGCTFPTDWTHVGCEKSGKKQVHKMDS